MLNSLLKNKHYVKNTCMSNPFVTKLNPDLVDKLLLHLKETGFTISSPEHTFFSAKKPGINVTLYNSYKLVIQGRAKDEFIEFYVEPELTKTFTYNNNGTNENLEEHIGVDESGKGDFFGPLCTVAVFANTEQMKKLNENAIKDSKTLKDDQIAIKASIIKKICPYKELVLMPKKYNELYHKIQNLNHLLGWCHCTAIENLIQTNPCKKVIIDQFANESLMQNMIAKKKLSIDLTQRVRAEEDVVVAAASILARDAFVKNLRRLEQEHNITLAKGAGPKVIQAGVKIMMSKGLDFFNVCAKTHFKTLNDIKKRTHTL